MDCTVVGCESMDCIWLA